MPGAATVSVAFRYTPKFYTFVKKVGALLLNSLGLGGYFTENFETGGVFFPVHLQSVQS